MASRIVFFSVAVTLGALYNSGYVLVVAPPYRIELSLNLLVAVLLALLFIAYFVVRLAVLTSGCQPKCAIFARGSATRKRMPR